MSEFFELLNVKPGPAVAALFGSIISLRYSLVAGWYQTAKGWGEMLYLLFCGFGISTQCAHGLLVWQKLSPSSEIAVAFILALFGLSAVEVTTNWIRNTKLTDLISGWLPKRPDK